MRYLPLTLVSLAFYVFITLYYFLKTSFLSLVFHRQKLKGEQYTYDFIRPDQPVFSLTYRLLFKHNRLVVINYPDVFYNAVSTSFALESLQLLGHSELPESGRWKVSAPNKTVQQIPSQATLLSVLGPPTSQSKLENNSVHHYTYQHPSVEGLQQLHLHLTYAGYQPVVN